MNKPVGKNKENLERTRKHLIDVATDCFATYGFRKTSTTKIVEAAESSRGSLYHHFKDKVDIFKAVYDSLGEKMGEIVEGYATKNEDPRTDLIEGCVAYLHVFVDAAFAQVMLIDGPNVLGWDYCRSQDEESAYAALLYGVEVNQGSKEDAKYIADFLSGALDSYALKIATSENREAAFHKYADAFRKISDQILD
ncbi:TetR/AcrR family transcriptional regulator [Curvivirga sp.]|uniref:TetR/AcrR family transcriptional regulator n=1 Tax=Curvivirga sp. TaxID=2856848 RepID=UPI003B599BF3